MNIKWIYLIKDISIMLRIKTLQELSFMIEKYNNPMILSYYKGKDWKNYTLFDYYNTKEFKISKNLYLINCISFQNHKIKNNDIIKVLDGSIVVDSCKRVDEEDLPYLYDKYTKFNKYSINDIYTGSDGKLEFYIRNKDIKDYYGICEGKSIYNTFLHYKSL